MAIPGVLIFVLIAGVLLDFDAWGIVLALFFCGFFAWLFGG